MWQHCFAEADFTNNFQQQIYLCQMFGIVHTCYIEKKPSNENYSYSLWTGFLNSLQGEGMSAGQILWNSINRIWRIHSSGLCKENDAPPWEGIKINIYFSQPLELG